MKMSVDQFSHFMIEVWKGRSATSWHWFRYHFDMGPRPFAMEILEACATIDRHTGEIGTDLLRELFSIGGMEKHEPHYEQILQKLAEILVIERIVTSEWPAGTTFEHEPAALRGGPRPELLVTHPGGRLVVEVKTPSLLSHIRARAQNAQQLPYRGLFPRDYAQQHLGQGGLTLPRDYPIRDFLVDADRKFAGVRDETTAALLVIVWDDFIYEPISILVNQGSGLLTPNSFERDTGGQARQYPNIDAVVAVRHLDNIIKGTKEDPIAERRAMDFGERGALPNVSFDVSGIARIPDHVLARLRAVPHDNPGLKNMAEYNTTDMVLWIDLPPR